MKGFHVHLAVDNLAKNIDFYSKLFGQQPSVEKEDYAKWMLEDPRVNFAISARGYAAGINHFGFQAENSDELAELKQRAEAAAGDAIFDEGETACCYAMSEKHWTTDPSGIAWEHYHTMGEIQSFGNTKAEGSAAACCVPAASAPVSEAACCVPAAPASAAACCAPAASGARGCC